MSLQLLHDNWARFLRKTQVSRAQFSFCVQLCQTAESDVRVSEDLPSIDYCYLRGYLIVRRETASFRDRADSLITGWSSERSGLNAISSSRKNQRSSEFRRVSNLASLFILNILNTYATGSVCRAYVRGRTGDTEKVKNRARTRLPRESVRMPNRLLSEVSGPSRQPRASSLRYVTVQSNFCCRAQTCTLTTIELKWTLMMSGTKLNDSSDRLFNSKLTTL